MYVLYVSMVQLLGNCVWTIGEGRLKIECTVLIELYPKHYLCVRKYFDGYTNYIKTAMKRSQYKLKTYLMIMAI